ncbi:MAG: endonuclease III, partial [Candidatus Nanohaloarchaea archaeon]
DFLHDKDLEEAKDWLTGLPGVGPKSAAVVLNFTFSKAAFPVDTHVFRVSKRLGLIPADATRESAHDVLEQATPDDRIYEFHINLIRHGRTVCKAPTPHCTDCTLRGICEWYGVHESDPDAYK